MDTQEQNQVEIQSVNPVPNRRPINDLHYTAINSNFRQQSKLNSGSNTSPPGSSAGGSEETKALLPTVGPSGRKFVIVPCQTGGAIGDPGGTVPSGSGGGVGGNGAPIVKVEPGEGSLSSGPSSITVPTAPVGTYLKPKYFNSLRSVRSANDPQGLANVQQPQTTIARSGSYIFSDVGGTPRLFSDATSIRSLASIGMGSTDGRRMVIRRVPNSPNELLTMINPPTPPDETYENESYGGMSDDSDLDNLKPRKQHWANKMQFVLACIGYSVGLGNVWRFPYLCYKSGGGVFLVPYFIILLICGIPMLFMELAVGQYTGRGPIGALGQLCPLFKGTGLASVVVSFLMSTYYSVIIAYAIYYFFTSFRPELPWTDCSHRWNTPDCWIPERLKHNLTRPDMSRTPTEEFFENKVLQISHGIEYPGAMRWELVACLVCAWILVYFAIWKSIKSSAKVRYLTATLPFVLIVVFLGRSLTLEGADKGLHYFFRPNWEELGRANVWINAAAQNFNSIGIAFGSMISFASYNKYNNNILHDTLAVSFVNAITSLLVGIFAFATIGNIALEQNTTVENVISGGPGLIFVVYPQALAKMPAAQLWAVLFFFMLLCLGLNSQFAIVEVVVTSIQDGFPRWIKRKLVYHELLVLIVCVVSFFAGLPNLIQGGIYFFQLIDHYAASVSIMFLAFFETIAIAWFYGINRLSKNVKQMTGRYPSFYLRFCLLIAVPLLLISLWIFSLINYEAPTYHNGKYHYPGWAHGLGWTIASASLVCIPSYAVYQIVRAEGNTFGEKLLNTLKPNIYECKICGEHHCDHDFPDEELGPEMTIVESTSGAPLILQPPPPGHLQYTQLQQQQQQQHQQQQVLLNAMGQGPGVGPGVGSIGGPIGGPGGPGVTLQQQAMQQQQQAGGMGPGAGPNQMNPGVAMGPGGVVGPAGGGGVMGPGPNQMLGAGGAGGPGAGQQGNFVGMGANAMVRKPPEMMPGGNVYPGSGGAVRSVTPNNFLRQSPSPSVPSPVGPGAHGPPSHPGQMIPSPALIPSPNPHMGGVAQRSTIGQSPGGSLNTPGQPGGAVPSPLNPQDEQLYREKYRALTKYIEPLKRMIAKMENDDIDKIAKMKRLLEILSNPSVRIPLETLHKCEAALTSQLGSIRETPTNNPLVEAVSSSLQAATGNHTLQRTFRPCLEALFGPDIKNLPPPAKQSRLALDDTGAAVGTGGGVTTGGATTTTTSTTTAAATTGSASSTTSTTASSTTAPQEIPHILQGEIARLDQKFKVSLDQCAISGTRTIKLICWLDDKNLPCVPPVAVTIPEDYPSTAPSCSLIEQEYNATPFLILVQKSLMARICKLPGLFTLSHLLDTWEMSVRQACSPNPTIVAPTGTSVLLGM